MDKITTVGLDLAKHDGGAWRRRDVLAGTQPQTQVAETRRHVISCEVVYFDVWTLE